MQSSTPSATPSRRPAPLLFDPHDSSSSHSLCPPSPKRARASPSPLHRRLTPTSSRKPVSRLSPAIPCTSNLIFGGSASYQSASTVPARRRTGDDNLRRSQSSSRRRDMTVPLLSQTFSSVSLSHAQAQTATPPSHTAPDLTPDASFRSASSSTDHSMSLMVATPATEAGTPLHPSKSRLHELTHSPAPPMPAISSLLGSPFNSRKPLPFEFSIASPTWNHGKDSDAPGLSTGGWDDHPISSPTDMVAGALSPGLSKPHHHYPSTDDGSGSCTSASSSSMFSPEYNALGSSSARPTVVGLWPEDAIGGGDDDEPPPAARAKLFGGMSVKGKKSASRLEPMYSPGPGSPLAMACNSRFSSSPSSSPVQRSFLSVSTSAVEGHSSSSVTAGCPSSPVQDYFSRKPQSCRKRPTTERLGAAGSPHELFLSQCHSRGFELTPRPDGQRTPGMPRSDDVAVSDHSPLGRGAAAVHALPLSPSAPSLSRSNRPEGLQLHLTPRNRSPASVSRSKSNRARSAGAPARPPLRRGLTEPAHRTPKAPPVPQLGTPVSELFGDDKPSPAAFGSSGLVKKRGARLHIPRFQARMARAPPQPPAFDGSGARRPGPSRPAAEHAGSDTETEESDEDQLSPIKPLRSGPFRMSVNSMNSMGSMGSARTHSRNASLASDIASSPFRRSHGAGAGAGAGGHARMSSTASSIGGSGLRRKSSAMFGGMASDGEFSPATPTKPLPLALQQPPLFGLAASTPSPGGAGAYPFSRRSSVASSADAGSPACTPSTAGGRVRALSRGLAARLSNPMLAGSRAPWMPPTPASVSAAAEGCVPEAARAAGAGKLERDFALVQALGAGAFSSVWKVRARSDGRAWAVKTGRPYTGARNRQRQLEEVAILARLSEAPHAGILRFAEAWEQGGRLHIRTELAECGDLARYLLSLGDTCGLDEGRVWKVAAELGAALAHIHAAGVLHLDFKPANILVTREGALKVADFGTSVFASPHSESSTRRPSPTLPSFAHAHARADSYTSHLESTTNKLLGLAPPVEREEGDREYLCPEALHDARPGPEADVFSLGILLLEAALNVCLPSNGDAWVKLRNDDYSDLDEHFLLREQQLTPSGPAELPVVSGRLLSTIKQMMLSSPQWRIALDEVMDLPPLVRAGEAMRGDGMWAAAPALVDEDDGWLEYLLE